MTQPPPYGYHPYPQQQPPPPRRRTGLIVAIVVGCVAMLGLAVTAAVVLPNLADDSASDVADSGSVDDQGPADSGSGQAKPPPSACELLSKTQLQALLPGEVPEPEVDEPPADYGGGMLRTSCTWRNDPFATGEQLPSASVRVDVVATPDENAAKAQFDTGGCDSEFAADTTPIPSSDEACLLHKQREESTNEPVGAASVLARQTTTVVEIEYNHSEKPIDEIDDVVVTGAASLLGKLGGGR